MVYAGDTLRAFSPHAWNEVVIDGLWVPVDPTWGQTTIDATHLRFPASIKGWFQVLATVPHMRLTVLDFKIKSQKSVSDWKVTEGRFQGDDAGGGK